MNTSPRIAVLSNKHSGKTSHFSAPSHILSAQTINEEEALTALKNFAEHGIDTLAIHGGDGTLDTAIRLIREHKIFNTEPHIALLKGGTTNMTWRDVGIKQSPKQAIQNLLQNPDRYTTLSRDVIKITSESLPCAQYGFFFGCGAIPRAIVKTRKDMHQKGVTGPLGETWIIAQMIIKLLSGRVQDDPILSPTPLSCAGKNYDSVFLVATTLNRLLLNLKPIDIERGMGIASLNAPYRNFFKIWRDLFGKDKGEKIENEMFRIYKKNTKLLLDGAWTLDGELFETHVKKPLHIKVDEPIQFVALRDKS